MSNELIKTDGIWYKIKRFVSNIFLGKKKEDDKVNIIENQNTNESSVVNTQIIDDKNEEINKSFKEEISYREEMQEENRKEKMAQMMMNGEIDSYDLSDEEVDEMTEWFMKDIEKQDKELQRIKEHILQMKKQLQG